MVEVVCVDLVKIELSFFVFVEMGENVRDLILGLECLVKSVYMVVEVEFL